MTDTTVRKLLLGLTATGVALIIAVTASASWLARQRAVDAMVAREAEVKQQFLNSILKLDAPADTLFAQPAPSASLAAFGAHVKGLPELVRANVYSPDGFIRFSTDPNLLGVSFRENQDLRRALGGGIAAALETIDGNRKAEHLALNQISGQRLIEAYIPLTGGDGTVAGVVEFYQRGDLVEQMAAGIARDIWAAGIASAAVLAGAMLMALRLGGRRK